jgi:hypothetical protein
MNASEGQWLGHVTCQASQASLLWKLAVVAHEPEQPDRIVGSSIHFIASGPIFGEHEGHMASSASSNNAMIAAWP